MPDTLNTYLVLVPQATGGSTLLSDGPSGCPAISLNEARAWTIRKLAEQATPATADIYTLNHNGQRVFLTTIAYTDQGQTP